MDQSRTREQRLRRMADRQGLRLVSSRRRDERAIDYGKWMLVDQASGNVIAGAGKLGRAEFSLDEVEQYLTRDR